MTAWLDRVAADLLHTEQQVRSALRRITANETEPRQIGWRSLEISVLEARTLLRGVMPAPIAIDHRLRRQHGRLVAALSLLSRHLLALNDPLHQSDAAIGAACLVVDELRDWIALARWRAATRRARVRWPVPADIRPIRRLEARPSAEHLPNAAGDLHHPAATIRQVHQLRTEQLALDLQLPASADVVELRQLRLQLTPATQEENRAAQAA